MFHSTRCFESTYTNFPIPPRADFTSWCEYDIQFIKFVVSGWILLDLIHFLRQTEEIGKSFRTISLKSDVQFSSC